MADIHARQEMTRTEVANYLREFAAKFETEGIAGDSPHFEEGGEDHVEEGGRDRYEEGAEDRRVTLMVGNDSTTINPPETVSFEVDVDSNDALLSDGAKRQVEFVLTWEDRRTDEEEAGEKDLEIK